MVPSVEKSCRYLCSVRDLYQSAQECLQTQNTPQVDHKNRVEEELDESLRLLDVIGMTRDVMVEMKEHVNDIQSALRRRSGGESDMGSKTDAFHSFRKKMKRQIVKHIKDLKRNAVKSVTRSSLVSKRMGTGRAASEGEAETMNDVARVEAYLSSLRGHKSPKHKGIEEANYAQKQLEALEVSIRPVQDGLDCLFKYLMKTRVSLLNSSFMLMRIFALKFVQ
ncbi:uncharacterized protein [Aristolochia californica]|uniref:uncharacterized protein n=1 Tax=Aristolochia californica TaxID=171875 RepID=UPI0035D9C7B3